MFGGAKAFQSPVVDTETVSGRRGGGSETVNDVAPEKVPVACMGATSVLMYQTIGPPPAPSSVPETTG
jgi:hypothetical protein